jgi:hypothetical protein
MSDDPKKKGAQDQTASTRVKITNSGTGRRNSAVESNQ